MRKFLAIVTILLIGLTSFQVWMTKDRTDQEAQMEQTAGTGNPLIGGSFTLTDQHGKTVSDQEFRGRLMLVFFGFTNCPDICPVTAANLSKTMELLGTDADKVAPVFITVDPERDTPAVMKNYFANFDKRMVALTGSPEQVKAAAEAYKAYYAKRDAQNADHAHGSHGDAHGKGHGDYGVDHSGYIYLMDKEGKYVMHFPYDASAQQLADMVRKQLNG